jgi:hypothetical protein
MSLGASHMNNQLTSYRATTDNLTAACKGIMITELAHSSSAWHNSLQSELTKAQLIARAWVNEISTVWQGKVLDCIAHCKNRFSQDKGLIAQLFDQAQTDPAKRGQLLAMLAALDREIQLVAGATYEYGAIFSAWGQKLQIVHDRMKTMIGDIQAKESSVAAEIAATNALIAELKQQVTRERQAIAEAKSKESAGIVETIFGVLLAFVSLGASLVLAGIGVASIVEAEEKVAALEATISSYQSKIVAQSKNLSRDQAQIAALQGLIAPIGIALEDLEIAAQLVDNSKVGWHAFSQEMQDTLGKIEKAETAEVLIVQKAWFHAACLELDSILAGTVQAPVRTTQRLLTIA